MSEEPECENCGFTAPEHNAVQILEEEGARVITTSDRTRPGASMSLHECLLQAGGFEF